MTHKVAIVGAPGSGKSSVIAELDNIWELDDPVGYSVNPGWWIEHKFDQAMGPHASYREDLWSFFTMLEEEKRAVARGDSFAFSNGGLLAPLAHGVANLETLKSNLKTPEIEREIEQRQFALTVLTMLFIENAHYSLFYYLPFPIKQAEEREPEYAYNMEVDNAIELILSQFGVWDRIQKVPGSPEEQAAFILSDIKSKLAKLNGDDTGDTPAAN